MVFKSFRGNYKKANRKKFHKKIFHRTIIWSLAASFAIKLKNCSFWPVFGNQSTKCTVSALHRGNDNLLRAEFISGKKSAWITPEGEFFFSARCWPLVSTKLWPRSVLNSVWNIGVLRLLGSNNDHLGRKVVVIKEFYFFILLVYSFILVSTQEKVTMEEGKILTQKQLALHRLDFLFIIWLRNRIFFKVIMKVC